MAGTGWAGGGAAEEMGEAEYGRADVLQPGCEVDSGFSGRLKVRSAEAGNGLRAQARLSRPGTGRLGI